MNEGDATIRLAIELLQMPSRVRFVRDQPLPPGILQLLQVAAGNNVATERSARTLERPNKLVREACQFYIEQVLLAPESDSYRVLGAAPTATSIELRRNMALLLRGLHPDLNHEGRSVFAQRITGAWNQLKTKERRSAYDLRARGTASLRRNPSRASLNQRRRRPTLRERLAAVLGMAKY